MMMARCAYTNPKTTLAINPKGRTHYAKMTAAKTLATKRLGIELDGVRYDAGELSLMGLDCNPAAAL
jgi:hypothetical protein